MEFEWDEAKRHINIEKHGIDFEDARALFDGRPTITTPRHHDDEERFATTGLIGDLFYTAIWIQRGDTIRLISVRRARDEEKRKFRSIHS
jgi:uncharacterized protein